MNKPLSVTALSQATLQGNPVLDTSQAIMNCEQSIKTCKCVGIHCLRSVHQLLVRISHEIALPQNSGEIKKTTKKIRMWEKSRHSSGHRNPGPRMVGCTA